MGSEISYGELFVHIDECVSALTALKVKQGDIVTVAMPSTPEALYMVYALNKIGAVANMIHPLAGEKELLHYLDEVNSEVAVFLRVHIKLSPIPSIPQRSKKPLSCLQVIPCHSELNSCIC